MSGTETKYIVQISDTHLFGDKNRKINGSNSYLNLKTVLNYVTSTITPDLIFVTGDLSQDCTFESYQHLSNLLNKTGIRYRLLPGNHDDVDVINKVFEYDWIKDSVDYGVSFYNWFVYVVDTSVYPDVSGALSSVQLKNLEMNLNKNKDMPTIVFMHHHPIPVKSEWLDNYILKNPENFNQIIKSNKQIKAVLFGHIHQIFEQNINGVLYASAPASCYQVMPNTKTFTIDKLVPGFRLIELNGENFNSKVVWINQLH